MPTDDRTRIEIVPIGAVNGAEADTLARLVSRRVGVPCRVGAAIPDNAIPELHGRGQADADALLGLLEGRPSRPGTIRIGVTQRDLGHPLFTFFFGRARMGGAALVSLHRLDPSFYGLPADPAVLGGRAVVECLHELGHVAGLHHCDDYQCVMHFSGDVEMLDLRGGGFCAACAAAATVDALRLGRV